MGKAREGLVIRGKNMSFRKKKENIKYDPDEPGGTPDAGKGENASMLAVRKSLDDLIVSLENCDDFKKYKTACTQVRLHPEKEQRLQEFRKRNYLLQNSREPVDLFAETDRLEREFADVFQDPMLQELLNAEVAVCRIVQQVNREMISCLDFENVLVDD